jgi:O-acetyl-ADP-ribose deacetylase (regulator of RNase III)
LGAPHDVAAKFLFEEIEEFEKRITNCTIKEVRFVVYNQDSKSIEAFRNELKKQAGWDNSGHVGTVPVVSPTEKWEANRNFNLKSPSTEKDSPLILKSSLVEADNSVMCVQVGEDKEVEIVKGDITKETTDVIAHLTNPGMSLQSGVAMALARAGGQDIERECQDNVDSTMLQIATTVLTTAGQLDAKYVAHMVASNNPSSNEIEKCISNCLKAVSEKECKSISFPAVGTGVLKHDPEKAATAIFTSVIRFLESSPGPLKTVRIVLKDDHLVRAFQASAKKLNEDEEPGMLKKSVNYFWKSDSTAISVKEKAPVIRKKLLLEIYAKDEITVNRAKERILKIMESRNKKDKLEDDNIEKLSKEEINEIKHLCKMNDVKVTIEKELNRIVVVGHSYDIFKTSGEIYKLLKRIGEQGKEKEKAALLADSAETISQGVQWFFIDRTCGDHYEYDKQTSAIIERAYIKKEKSVIFLVDDEQYEIVFDKMQEFNLDRNDTIKVIRKNIKGI